MSSKDATNLPVRLAVSLLKDRHGEIHFDLPVSGFSMILKFSVWGVVLMVPEKLAHQGGHFAFRTDRVAVRPRRRAGVDRVRTRSCRDPDGCSREGGSPGQGPVRTTGTATRGRGPRRYDARLGGPSTAGTSAQGEGAEGEGNRRWRWRREPGRHFERGRIPEVPQACLSSR